MKNQLINWGLFLTITVIWGSSFILMKEGLVEMTAFQVAAMRIFSAGLVLLPITIGQLRVMPMQKIKMAIFSATIGNFIPAFFFCIAETKINSSLASIVNALTPLFAILMGVLFFNMPFVWKKVAGVLVGFAGLCLLFLAPHKEGITFDQNQLYALFVVAATMCYGVNPNLIVRHLQGINSLHIAAIGLSVLAIPSFFILLFTGYFTSFSLSSPSSVRSTLASVILGVLGTAVAQIFFLMLLKRTGVVFSSLATYIMPFVAIVWGIYYGETITAWEFGCLGIILSGVYFANKKTA
ncbi:MAG: DMT family transporter [Saprospiraceae bacterium]|nr:DMT family transporter [Saprospiraceae bacterium]